MATNATSSGRESIDQPDCMNTRNEVLARDSETKAVRAGCKVSSGGWDSPYDGERWSAPSQVQIDH